MAGGDGTRLKELTTTPSGRTIPKQFCSFHGESSLLEDAIGRAAKVAMPQYICSVVAAKHRRWWPDSLRALPQQNVLVQPCNRGTAHGILFALLQIQMRAPDSIVLMLPADHYVGDEATLARALRILRLTIATWYTFRGRSLTARIKSSATSFRTKRGTMRRRACCASSKSRRWISRVAL